MAREIQGEGGAFPDRAIDENIPPRLFNNTVGGGQPQPRPLAGPFGGVEGFKHFLQPVPRNTFALVSDLNSYILPNGHGHPITCKRFSQLGIFCRDLDFPAHGHRIARVHDQVHQHLFQLPFICTDGLQDRVMAERQSHRFTNQTIKQMGQVGKRVAHIDRLGAERLLA